MTKKKSRDIDLGFVAEALPAFIQEATEQVEQIEQLLLALEEAPGDRDKLDALFRCAHTVKGSAGIFGLDRIVAFTHDVETLLDRLREGRAELDLQVSTLLLQCNDQIRLLITQAADEQAESADQIDHRADLSTRLKAMLAALDDGVPASAEAAAVRQDSPEAAAALPRWHLCTTFGPDTFRNGMDPLSVLSYLDTLGDVHAICCDTEAVPPLDRIDPESCHGAFQFTFDSTASRAEIEAAFAFVRDDCTLRLTAPGTPVSHFKALIDAMPERPRLGEILVAIGAVTREELDLCLGEQAAMKTASSDDTPRLGEMLQVRTGVDPQVIDAAVVKQKQLSGDAADRKAGPADEQRYIRVQADRLDAVINLLGELVTAGAGAAMLSRQTRQGSLIEAHLNMGRLIEEIRNGTLQLRMVPIGETFSRFRRVVRDTAAQLGKDVALEIQGGETELDKSMVERIVDPLMHLVRNSLDHGLENAADRIAAGKSATGTLMLSARHESGTVLITIEDDGRGIARDKVLQRAWQRGLVEPGVTPSDAEILHLIFAPGFSTAEQVTNLSGRGVGMDVVKRNIEALRGSVTVHSVAGRGTQIQIRLPLTLAIIDGFLVSAAQSRFVLPLASVVEVIEGRRASVDQAGLARLDDAGELAGDSGRRCVELRGEMLPVIDLRTLYDLEAPPAELPSIVVVKGQMGTFGIVVDALMGQHQTVIKPLGPIFRSLRGISGSSILGNGEVALILDVQALGQLAERTPPPPGARRRPGPTAVPVATAERP
ncbi:chemotaxis protein CheA [Sphaerotilus mobilis]|uniref:Chemotaxis protein CheA n=1 Tax=Sphaerotilus mobilis TaxID=47994 RepID=A0A4Q7LEP7_9BURK|nr:chemotaxis protein CheA [Sphaerotilus mobilis]RZS52936.1 two-component system chemotaxis sensor kinase CheA [Sphaerotilus mobilis]